MAKRRPDHPPKGLLIGDLDPWGFVDQESNQGRIHFWPGKKALGRENHLNTRCRVELKKHGQGTIVLGHSFGNNPQGHLFLEHENHG